MYPFLTYGIVILGNTYESTLKPIFIYIVLQKKAMHTYYYHFFSIW